MHVLQPPLDFCDNSTDRVGTGLRPIQAERSSAACGKRNPRRLKPPPRLEPNAALKRCSTQTLLWPRAPAKKNVTRQRLRCGDSSVSLHPKVTTSINNKESFWMRTITAPPASVARGQSVQDRYHEEIGRARQCSPQSSKVGQISSRPALVRTGRESAWAQSGFPGCLPANRRRHEMDACCRPWCGGLRETPECCSPDPRILRRRRSSRGSPPPAARETG